MTSVSIEVERPADEVFRYATDPSRFHEWQHGVAVDLWRATAHRRWATTA